jgi:hypothetical protein
MSMVTRMKDKIKIYTQVSVHLALCLTKHHAMKAYEEVEL